MRIKDMIRTMRSGDSGSREKADRVKHQLYTVQGEELLRSGRIPFEEYPRPQMVREFWQNLNGWWECQFDHEKTREKILVPFSPEAALSGVGRQLLPGHTLCYRRFFETDLGTEEGHVLLHLGAVDQWCRVWVNGECAGDHMGGYLPFTFDITDKLRAGENELRVLVRDDSDTGYHAKGKQRLRAEGMYYTAQSGIWQTVWLEWVPDTYIEKIGIDIDYDNRQLKITADLNQPGDKIPAILQMPGPNGHILIGSCADRKMTFHADISTYEEWTPDDPKLHPIRLRIGMDDVESYFAVRKFSVERQEDGKRRFCLNGSPLFLNGVLDQGYWPEGLYTAPGDAALVQDIENMKVCGFNMMRKHCKLEPLRWYYHCDRLGMIVWQDLVSGGENTNVWWTTYLPTFLKKMQSGSFWRARPCGRMSEKGRNEWLGEARETVELLSNTPSLATWVIFNEGWGQFSTGEVTEMVRKWDPTRPVDAASGWFDFGCGDYDSRHIYFSELACPEDTKERAAVISEYGGVTLSCPGHVFSDAAYGYHVMKSRGELREAFERFQEKLKELQKEGLSGAVYTQVSDIEEEINGIYTYDRKICKLKEE